MKGQFQGNQQKVRITNSTGHKTVKGKTRNK